MYLFGYHLSFSWSCCLETVNRTFFSDHPWRIQLQQCLEISEITVYLRKTIRAYLIPSFSRRHVPVMKSLISPLSPPSLFLPLSPYLHLSLFFPLLFCPFFLCWIPVPFLSFSLIFPSFLFFSFLIFPFLSPHTSLFLSPPSYPPHSIATGDYCGRPEGGAHTQRADCV